MVTFPFQFVMDPLMLFPDLYNVEISGIWENDGHGGEEEEGLPKQYFVSDLHCLFPPPSQVHPRRLRLPADDDSGTRLPHRGPARLLRHPHRRGGIAGGLRRGDVQVRRRKNFFHEAKTHDSPG